MKSFLTILLITSSVCFGQIDSATTRVLNTYQFGGIYKSAVSFNLGGVAGYAGFSYDYFLSQKWRLEAGLGYYGVGFGFDYYPWSIKREKARFKINQRNLIFFPGVANVVIHGLGFGMTKFFKARVNFGFDVGIAYHHPIDSFEPYDYIADDALGGWLSYPSANFKIGYRFSFKYMKRKRELEREKE